MKSSTTDKVEGKFHKAKGKVKEIAGKVSDNPKLEAEGTTEKIAGKVQERSVRLKRYWESSQNLAVCGLSRKHGFPGVNTYDPCRTRTYNPRIKSPLLYQLS
jgi:uncharacterized protein YjbJ (UPF0337 family)